MAESRPDLKGIKNQLRRLDVLSGLAGSKAADADVAALCEQIAFNDVAELVSEVERLRAALEAIAHKECVTPDIHFVQVVSIAREALR